MYVAFKSPVLDEHENPSLRATTPETAQKERPSLCEGADLRLAMRVLIVDDSASQRLLLKAIVGKQGYLVDTAKSGEDALRAINTTEYRIIISDWIMPGMTGPELCRSIRHLGQSVQSYFILSSSKSEKRDIAEGLDAGADDFIAKPVDEHELLARIRSGVRTVRLQEQLYQNNLELNATHERLHDAYNTMDSDIRIASRIQSTLMPDAYSNFNTLEVATVYVPCHHLGGDLVGYFSPNHDCVAAYSIDVSGHGIPSALLSTVLSQSLSGLHQCSNLAINRHSNGEPALLLPHDAAFMLNNRFQDWGRSGQYFTMSYVQLNPSNGNGLLCQAGHPSPAIIRASGVIDFIGSGGMPIGMLPMATYDSVPFELSKGDILVLYSDGITEAELPDGSQLGEDGLVKVLENMRDCPIAKFSAELVARTTELCGGKAFTDDVSAIALKR
jgi:phosphoserine phosphatase RsbU/P